MGDTATFQPSEDLLKLTGFFATREPGDELSWDMIQAETGVEMDQPGRDMARRATERAGHPAPEPIPGWGLRMASPDNALPATARRARKAARAAARAAKHAGKCLVAFADTLDPDVTNSLRHQQAAYAGIGLVAGQTAKEADKLHALSAASAETQQTAAERMKAAQMAALTQAKKSTRKLSVVSGGAAVS